MANPAEAGGDEAAGDEAPLSPHAAALDALVTGALGAAPTVVHRPLPRRRRTGAVSPPPVEAVAIRQIASPEHWHLVTYGISGPSHGDPGWDFELTLRVSSEEEPMWATDLLINLAAYVEAGGHPFAEGHLVDLRGPIRLDRDTDVTAAVIVSDPGLEEAAIAEGTAMFLQVVGLTGAELELCRAWSAEGVVGLLRRDDPLTVLRLDREPVVSDPRFTEEIERAMALEGSSLHELHIATLRLRRRLTRRTVVEMASGASTALGPALRRELVGDGATFRVVGDHWTLRFVAAAEAGWGFDEEGIVVTVPRSEVEEVAARFDGRAGWFRLAGVGRLWFRVVD